MPKEFGTNGCPVEVSEDWTLEQLDNAVAYGAHPSAESPEASQALRQEALEKVDQRFAKLIPWREIQALILKGLKTHTKISPIAAIPHKSRLFRMILDLSMEGQKRKAKLATKSVNELTNEETAPLKAMEQPGSTLGRITLPLQPGPPTKAPSLEHNGGPS